WGTLCVCLQLCYFCLWVVFASDIELAEARTCGSSIQRFKGLCVRNNNCASFCNTEGFPTGKCEGFRRRCFCTRNC
ncbi:Defensin-like protein, partial [Capsicum chinense]